MVAISQQQNNKLKNVNSILTYEDVVAWLDSSWNNAEPVNNDRVKNLDKILGNPSQSFKSIIVSGDNGKSLTVNFISQLLREEKVTVGAYYSPHINNYTERFAINNEIINIQDFTATAQEVFNASNQLDENLHATEILTAIAFLSFKKKNVTIAVLESINNSAFDPAQIANKTVVAITRLCNENDEVTVTNLVQYVSKNCWLVSADQSKANLQFMEDLVEKRNGKWAMPIRKLAALEYPFEQLHGRCAALAERASQLALEEIYGQDSQIIESSLLLKSKGQRGRPTLEAKFNSELNPKKTIEDFWKETTNSLPGRFELIKKDKPLVLLDNAANLDAFNNLFLGIRLLHYAHQLKGLVLIIGCDNNKLSDIEFLRAARYFFKKNSGQIIFCPISQDNGKKADEAFDVEKITNEIRNYKVKAKSAKNLKDAYAQALKTVDQENGLIVITGSTAIIKEFNKINN